jgi:phenylpyruvate tautomerase PptA (4-oxalocrotonate tautomerase family)
MPLLKVQTNREVSDKKKIMEGATELLSKVLSKPTQYIMVIIEDSVDMMFAGTNAPLAYVELKSIGLPESHTPNISADLCRFIEDNLGVPQNRIYIEFADAKRSMFGWNGGTF